MSFKEKIRELAKELSEELKREEENIKLNKTMIWRMTIRTNRREIAKLLKTGVKKRRLYEVIKNKIQEKFGEEAVINERSFYLLLKEEIENRKAQKISKQKQIATTQESVNLKDAEKDSILHNKSNQEEKKSEKILEDYNEQGLL